jgi:hypothetical protein
MQYDFVKIDPHPPCGLHEDTGPLIKNVDATLNARELMKQRLLA